MSDARLVRVALELWLGRACQYRWVGAVEAFEARRVQLLAAVVHRLETGLPDGTPGRVGAARGVWDVLCADLTVGDVRGALRSIASGPGGELTPTAAGNIAMCSAESSALMAVNFLAGFPPDHSILPGVLGGTLSFERELRVTGVRAPVGPTLDVVHESAGEIVAFEVKTGRALARTAARVDLTSVRRSSTGGVRRHVSDPGRPARRQALLPMLGCRAVGQTPARNSQQPRVRATRRPGEADPVVLAP